ncbi:MAG: hypothetical protein QM723_06665 [Myxococcaceae bacterium]
MSWDVHFMRWPEGVTNLEEMTEEFVPDPLGPAHEVIAKLTARLPKLDFSDRAWGVLEGPGFSIEFNLGAAPIADSLMLHVRGGPAAFGAVREVSEALGVPALDLSTGECIDFSAADASRGFDAWRTYLGSQR